jgi:Icc protein
VLDHIARHHADIDALLVTGDMVQSGGVATYRRLADYLDGLGLPWYWIPGNHDQPEALREAWGERPRTLTLAGWRILLLDSTADPDGRGGGSLAAEELARLRALEGDDPVLLVLHHNPIPVGSPWQDAIGLGNAGDFLRALAAIEAPVTVLFGHTHQAWDRVEQGVRLLGCPSTAVQFRKGTREPAVESTPPLSRPGYRWLELFDTGQVQSVLERIDLA